VSAWLSLKMLWISNSQETAEIPIVTLTAPRVVLETWYADGQEA
jgi:hypothetical protein